MMSLSLDDDEKGDVAVQEINPKHRAKVLLFGGVNIEIPMTQIKVYAEKSHYFSIFFRDYLLHFKHLDEYLADIDFSNLVRPIRRSAFAHIQKFMGDGKRPQLTEDDQLDSLEFFANYIGIDTNFFYFSAEACFTSSLSADDREIRAKELELRTQLYTEEDGDYKGLDAHFFLSKIFADRGMREVGVEGEVQREEEITPFWGLLGPLHRCSTRHDLYREIYLAVANALAQGMHHHHQIQMPPEITALHNLSDEEIEAAAKRMPHKRGLMKGSNLPPRCFAKIGYTLCINHLRNKPNHDHYLTEDAAIKEGELYPTIGRATPFDLRKCHWKSSQFKGRFDAVTNNLFQNFDYGKFIIAGGSIFNIFTDRYKRSFHSFCYHTGSADASRLMNITLSINDLDLFLITRNVEEANVEIARLVSYVRSQINFEALIVRTPNTITVEARGPLKNFKIQIILRLYNSIAQVITGFDIDSCTVAWDGKHLYCTERFARCIRTGYNLADPERQSTSYSFRLFKYFHRGVAIALPGYNKERVETTSVQLADPTGLAKIVSDYKKLLASAGSYFNNVEREIVKETKDEPEKTISDYETTEIQGSGLLSIDYTLLSLIKGELFRRGRFNTKEGVDKYVEKYNFNVEEADLAEAEGGEDGAQKYYIAKKKELMIDEDIKLNIRLYSTVEELLSNAVPADAYYNINSTITEPGIQYKTKNVGGQLTNSFQPVYDEWFADLYVRRDGVEGIF